MVTFFGVVRTSDDRFALTVNKMLWKGETMTTTSSPVLKVFLIVFAIIGLLAVLAFAGMAFMHGSMANMMEAYPEMAASCQRMMPSSI